MSPMKQKIQALRDSVKKFDPWVSGSTRVPIDSLDLFYLDKLDPPQPHHLRLSPTTTSPDELDKLSIFCDRATSGRAKEEVLDESYRKVRKMDSDRFSSKLDSHVIRLLPTIIPHIEDLENGGVEAKLHELSIYDTGSFFRPHKDTPRSEDMFGTLLVVFPTIHTGGQFVLRHGKTKVTFDSHTTVSSNTSSLHDTTIAYIAFLSDVQNETLPVTSGHRITLTYHLYRSQSPLPGPVNANRVSEVKKALSTLLDNPKFLPKGGLLSFALSHPYSIQLPESNLDSVSSKSSLSLRGILDALKGEDAVIRCACEELGFSPSVKTILEEQSSTGQVGYKSWHGFRVLLHEAINFSHWAEIHGSWIKYILRDGRGILIHPYDEAPKQIYCGEAMDNDDDEYEEDEEEVFFPKPIFCVTDFADGRVGQSGREIIVSNSDGTLGWYEEYQYMLSLIVAVGPAWERWE
ncbi:hypothetical protein E1B28_011902 [Marasmius oreades]|uniref:Fe2OG dioxygenase domain-containing protein n=1 Tax=Marasmius oreades TaxID=181124 RepID=A0A9P7USL6_9AGAR|nr:uncharacterized protein E1B28_011902 [Marasmius oreades]KAG7090304.1 hypothetical protein E1B28_011902 [Marasmius oreades]